MFAEFATTGRRLRPARTSALALALVGALVAAPLGLAPVSPAFAQSRPTNLADLVDSVAEAVVNISATQTIDEKGAENMPDLPKGTPFDDMFEQFFKNHGFNGAPAHPRKSSSLGSGFVIDPSGIVITNNHVVGDANDIVVIFTDGRKLKAKVIGKDAKVDVAVLKVESDKPLKTVKFGDSDKMRVGDGVMAVGNPFGLGETVTAGIISARNRNIESGPYDDFLQTDASINKGNSGGPLFNMAGEVIGINTAILSPSGGSIGIGFATPSATRHAGHRPAGEVRRDPSRLARRAHPAGRRRHRRKPRPRTARGALVAGIDENGPAKPAGLQAGDVIVKFDGHDIKEWRDLPRLVASLPVGKEVPVVIMRKGEELTKTVTLGRLEDGEKQMAKADADETPRRRPNRPRPRRSAWRSRRSATETRKTFKLKDSVKGVVVTAIEPNSAAAEKGLRAGDVIEEVNQQAVEKPGRRLPADRRAEEAGQEIGAAARHQRRRRGALRRAGAELAPFREAGAACALSQ